MQADLTALGKLPSTLARVAQFRRLTAKLISYQPYVRRIVELTAALEPVSRSLTGVTFQSQPRRVH